MEVLWFFCDRNCYHRHRARRPKFRECGHPQGNSSPNLSRISQPAGESRLQSPDDPVPVPGPFVIPEDTQDVESDLFGRVHGGCGLGCPWSMITLSDSAIILAVWRECNDYLCEKFTSDTPGCGIVKARCRRKGPALVTLR